MNVRATLSERSCDLVAYGAATIHHHRTGTLATVFEQNTTSLVDFPGLHIVKSVPNRRSILSIR